jgi:hypothetical protein
MYYLVHYNRRSRKVVRMSEFVDRRIASSEKLAVEIQLLGRNNGDEVVVLEADGMTDLRQTHGRYFEDDLRKIPRL